MNSKDTHQHSEFTDPPGPDKDTDPQEWSKEKLKQIVQSVSDP